MIATNDHDRVIRYAFEFDDGHLESHEVVLDANTLALKEDFPSTPPDWTRLENHQCPNCPLRAEHQPYCPAAVAVSNLSTHFGHRASYAQVCVRVSSGARTIMAEAPLQSALFSLLGLRMATSGCPVLGKLRPMARFHLPFADSEETAYRAIAMFLVSRFLRDGAGLPAEYGLEELRRIYEDVHEINLAFSRRIREADSADANMNSLTTLDLFAQDVPYSIDSALEHLRDVFSPYLEEAPLDRRCS